MSSHEARKPRLLRTLLSTVPVLLLLLTAAAVPVAETLHKRLLAIGEENWPRYHEVRKDPGSPTCDPDAVFVPSAEQPKTEEEALLDDVLEDGGELDELLGGDDPAPDGAPGEESDDLDDLLGGADDDLDELDDEPPGGAAPAVGVGATADAAGSAPDTLAAVPDVAAPSVGDTVVADAGPRDAATSDAATSADAPRAEPSDIAAAAPDTAAPDTAAPNTAAPDTVSPTTTDAAPTADVAPAPAVDAGSAAALDAGPTTAADIAAASPEGESELDEALGGEGDGDEGLDELLGDDDLLDSVLGPEEVDDATARTAFDNAQRKCTEHWANFTEQTGRINDNVRTYRSLERSVEAFVSWGSDYMYHLLVLLLLVCATTATLLRAHISLRPIATRIDDRVSQVLQLVTNTLVLLSCRAQIGENLASGTEGYQKDNDLLLMLQVGFGIMGAANLWNLARPFGDKGGSMSRAMLTVPLYAMMGLIAGSYFVLGGHDSGLAIELGKIIQYPSLYIAVGLFVWVGMMLKETRIAHLFFDVLRPWAMMPEVLTVVVVVLAAVPTAYTGASGIFVIAVGAVIYKELRGSGVRRQMALAATAMSGSMGVVLKPCLLVVIVASLNYKYVGQDQLFNQGLRVFALTSLLFLLATLGPRLLRRLRGKQNAEDLATMASAEARRTEGPRSQRIATAAKESGRVLLSLAPYGVIVIGALAIYTMLMDAKLGPKAAPSVLAVMLILMLVYDRWRNRRNVRRATPPPPADAKRPRGFWGAMGAASEETSGHMGALIALMALSVCLGGIIDRAEIMSLVPETFGSVYLAMSLLVIVLVLIGMTMDPYGAVILVSATISEVAYRNGIDAVHFWMVVLCAFELGYLTPPVALNHLLTRQVVGDTSEDITEQETTSFWRRHERILLPVTVMGLALLIVAFGPLLVGYST